MSLRRPNPVELTKAKTKAQAGRLGGLSRSKAKITAVRANGMQGGRPPKYVRPTAPSFAYPGGKVRMAATILPLIPPSGHIYCEPFAGRGNVFFAAAGILNYESWWLNDLRTAEFFECLRDYGDKLAVPPRSRAQYYQRWADYKQNDCPYACLLEPYLTFGGGGYGTAGYCSSGRGGVTRSGYQQTIRMAHDILRATGAVITGLDYKDVLCGLGPEDFAYIDPPYKDSDVRSYKNNTLDHAELVTLLRDASFRWILSEYEHPVYKPLGKPVLRKTVQLTGTRLGNGSGETRTECIWKNF
jgi:site-specific DNA-adenine methylase